MADERASQFVKSLSELDRGDLARLRRNAGETLASSRGAAGLFYRILPDGIAGGVQEEIYFLVATLYGLNCKRQHQGDFGTTMAKVKAVKESESVDRRMAVLLDSEFGLVEGWRPGGGEMAYRMRQLVKLAAGHEVGVDWSRLIGDLSYWSHPARWVRKAWVQSYYGGGARSVEPAGTSEGGAQPC